MEIINPEVFHELLEGDVVGESVVCGKKTFKDNKDIYLNSNNFDDDTIMYDVFSYTKEDEKNPFNLNYGLSVLHPVYVNGECNMTRGHYHYDEKFPEIYVGLSGEGLLMLMSKNGECKIEKVFKGSVHHIEGRYAHRLINTGDDDLRVQAVWSPCAGHDYDEINKKGFKYRVFKIDGKIEVRENELFK